MSPPLPLHSLHKHPHPDDARQSRFQSGPQGPAGLSPQTHLLGLSPSSLTPTTHAFPQTHQAQSYPLAFVPAVLSHGMSQIFIYTPGSLGAFPTHRHPGERQPPPHPLCGPSPGLLPFTAINYGVGVFPASQPASCPPEQGVVSALLTTIPPPLQKDPVYSRGSVNACCIQQVTSGYRMACAPESVCFPVSLCPACVLCLYVSVAFATASLPLRVARFQAPA